MKFTRFTKIVNKYIFHIAEQWYIYHRKSFCIRKRKNTQQWLHSKQPCIQYTCFNDNRNEKRLCWCADVLLLLSNASFWQNTSKKLNRLLGWLDTRITEKDEWCYSSSKGFCVICLSMRNVIKLSWNVCVVFKNYKKKSKQSRNEKLHRTGRKRGKSKW